VNMTAPRCLGNARGGIKLKIRLFANCGYSEL